MLDGMPDDVQDLGLPGGEFQGHVALLDGNTAHIVSEAFPESKRGAGGEPARAARFAGYGYRIT
jgi:hypothetical protein